MATINPVIEEQVAGSVTPGGMVRVTWPAMANGDVGSPVRYHSHADRSIQVFGTFGAGGSVAVEGSLDEANFATLNDPQGVTLAVTTAKVKSIAEMSIVTRPHVTAGDGTTALTVVMIFRRQS